MPAERPQTVCARMSPEERDFVAAVAASQNMTVSAFAREWILLACKQLVEEEGAGNFAAIAAREEAERTKRRQERLAEKSLAKMAKSIDV